MLARPEELQPDEYTGRVLNPTEELRAAAKHVRADARLIFGDILELGIAAGRWMVDSLLASRGHLRV